VLEVADPAHIELIRALVVSGAQEGSWDPGLALLPAAADALIAKIATALRLGALPQRDPATGQWMFTRISGCVFRSDRQSPPIGFGLFRDFVGNSFELWLCGIQPAARGRGLGRSMLIELLATPIGQRARLARCALGSDGGRRCAHVLKSIGFTIALPTAKEEWLLHRSTPVPIVERIRALVAGTSER
jgi:hypothetical protein